MTRASAASVRRRAVKRSPSDLLHEHADAATALLKAVGSRNRLLLLCQMVEGERSVGELAAALGLAQSVVSQHLALLRHDGVVDGRREAQSIRYRIVDARVQTLMATLSGMFCGGARGY